MKTIFIILFMFLSVLSFSQNGKFIGQIKTVPNPTYSINYNITAGNTSTAFRINAQTGDLIINNQTAINANTNWKYTLTVRLRYSQAGVIVADTFRTIRILNMVNGKTIGTMLATDPDIGQKLTYKIMSGNYSTAFKINTNTGFISIANVTAITNWIKTKDTYVLNIRALDNGIPQKSSTANATIMIFGDVLRQDVFNCR